VDATAGHCGGCPRSGELLLVLLLLLLVLLLVQNTVQPQVVIQAYQQINDGIGICCAVLTTNTCADATCPHVWLHACNTSKLCTYDVLARLALHA
jgi:hypothetical protein